MSETAATERVLIAPTVGGHGRPRWARVDDRGRARIDGDTWVVLRDLATLEHVARMLHIPRGASKDRVLTELQVAGYWPAKAALRAFVGAADE